jgi:flagellar motor protein MotB
VLKQREAERRRILENLYSRLKTRGVSVSLDPGNGIIRLPEELFFDSGQAVLRPQGVQALKILAAELNDVLQRWCSLDENFRLEALFVEGHTDNVPIKNARFGDNWELSTARAVNIARALKQFQPEIAVFRNPGNLPVLGVSGYGENRPVADNSTDVGRRRNRRIDLRFLVAYPTDEQISKVTHGLISPHARVPLFLKKDTNTNP